MHRSWLRTLAVAVALAMALVIAGCEEGDAGPGDGPDSTRETVRTVVVTEETEPQVYALEGGRYRVSWRHQCETIGVRLVAAGAEPVYERTARSPAFSAIVSDVAPGDYELLQTDAACEDYEIRIDKL